MASRPGVTVRDVADRAGVALSTVSKALNRPHAVTPELMVRITDAIAELGYVRNEAARALRVGESNAVGLLLSEATSPFAAELAGAAGEYLSAQGYSVLVGSSALDPVAEGRLLRTFAAQRVRGVLMTPVSDSPSGLDSLASLSVPGVYLDSTAMRANSCAVSVDDYLGAQMAVEHLIGLGRRRIALVRGRVVHPQVHQRLESAKRVCASRGVELMEIVTGGYSVESGIEAGSILASRPKSARPDAVFAVNDLLAMGLVSSLVDRGFSIPRDIAVAGYDGLAVAAVARVPLTTVRQPGRDIAIRAAALLIEEMETPSEHEHEHTVMAPELIVRASSSSAAR
jgi:LacI family transcriptional regulator